MVGCLSGPSAPGRATPEPPAFGRDPRQIRQICQEGRRKGIPTQRDDRLGLKEGCEVVHTEVPPCRGQLKDPRLNGDSDLVRPRTEGARAFWSRGRPSLVWPGALPSPPPQWSGPGGAPVWVSPIPQSAPSLSSSFSRNRSKSRFLRSRPPSPPPSMAPP